MDELTIFHHTTHTIDNSGNITQRESKHTHIGETGTIRQQAEFLEVLSLAHNLLTGGLQQNSVLVLGSVAALHVTEWRVGVHYT